MKGIVRLFTAATTINVALSFGIPESAQLMQAVTHTATSHHHVVHHVASASHLVAPHFPANVLESYKHALATFPLPTKMITGATLAVSGDAIAQAQDKSSEYDKTRAASFAVFDMAYRALQHFSFPIIVAACHGQYLGAIPGLDTFADPSQLAAMEQTLASQLGIVPFLYYPAFFTLTGAMQGLDASGSWTRAKDNFIPLMKRNLLFWIPMQFIQFGYIQEDLQIPFLSVCGLAWTFILSVAAGSAKSYDKEAEEAKIVLSQLQDQNEDEQSSSQTSPSSPRSSIMTQANAEA